MACGIYLGVLLLCYLQAEHVRCLWASRQAQGKTYVGFVQDGGGSDPRRAGKAPQNQFRQAAQVRAPVQSGSSAEVSAQGGKPSSGGGGYSSLKVVRRRPVAVSLKKAVPVKPQRVSLSTAIASSGSLSRFNPPKSDLAVGPLQRFQKPNSGQRAEKSSGFFSTSYGKRKFLANMRTSANGAATKVLIGQKPARLQKTFPNHNQGHHVGQSNKAQQASGGRSGAGSDGERYAPTNVLIIPSRYGGFPIRRLKDPASQKKQKVAPQKPATSWAHTGTKWARIKLRP
ncbi:uncharacterized protein LOC133500340 [Syngnathoides biaculeatus]|uniref:uncharacterized protein LOC133500340 n=1 Tax=Syngnathoides biaculeatus TaxID=300417 RepID=UPI002ADDB62C|nr:uncharacterized protein LOC133500340 [Syngnathoides biaculeatus]